MASQAQVPADKPNIWAALAAPLSRSDISWRADGKPTTGRGGFSQRFVPFTDAQSVARRFDSVVPGEWDITIDVLPEIKPVNSKGEIITDRQLVGVKARLQVLGVIRENIGQGDDYKGAASDAFKRAAVRFGVGAELYDIGTVWARVDAGTGFPKLLEDPYDAYLRTLSGAPAPKLAAETNSPEDPPAAVATTSEQPQAQPTGDDPSCPKCSSAMWDNRTTKRNPKAPDWKCRDRSCDGVIWPPKPPANGAPIPANVASVAEGLDMAVAEDDEDLPF